MKYRILPALKITAGLIVFLFVLFIIAFKAGFTPIVSFWNGMFDYQKILAVNRMNDAESSDYPDQKKDYISEFNNANVVFILFLGIDRTDDREEYMSAFRSDTISLFRFDLDTKRVNVLCIPRDTYAYVPAEQKKDKINHAYAYGDMKGKAVESTIDAVCYFTGLPVDYYITLDLEPLPNIVDDIGGVEMDVEIDMKTYGANLSKGRQLLDGKKAFDYIHWRFSENGDIDRIKRQQKFLRALYKKQRDSGKLLETLEIILKYNKSLKTNLTAAQMISIAQLANDIPENGVNFYSIPGRGQTIDNISYWVPDEIETENLIRENFIQKKDI